MENDIIIYELPYLLNLLDDSNHFKIKTKKIYGQFYNKNYKFDTKRKTYIKETDAFSDERMIQDIRNVLGKVSNENKKYVIDTLKKNITIVNSKKKDECVKLLVQYATLCLEWNDLYLQIYNEVYYLPFISGVNKNTESNETNNSLKFHKSIYYCIEDNIWNYKQYDTEEQTIFFRCSNLQLFIKFSMLFPNYCIELCNEKYYSKEKPIKSLENWIVYYITRLISNIQNNENTNERQQIIECCIVFYKTMLNLTNNYLQDANKKFKIICTKYKKQIVDDLQNMIEQCNVPMKLQFKWMEITDLLS